MPKVLRCYRIVYDVLITAVIIKVVQYVPKSFIQAVNVDVDLSESVQDVEVDHVGLRGAVKAWAVLVGLDEALCEGWITRFCDRIYLVKYVSLLFNHLLPPFFVRVHLDLLVNREALKNIDGTVGSVGGVESHCFLQEAHA